MAKRPMQRWRLAEAARQRTQQVQTAFEIKNITERPPFSSSSCAARVTFSSISVNFIIGGRHGLFSKKGVARNKQPRATCMYGWCKRARLACKWQGSLLEKPFYFTLQQLWQQKTFEEEMTYISLSLSRNSKSISRGLTCPALVDFLQHFVNILPYCALCPSRTFTGS